MEPQRQSHSCARLFSRGTPARHCPGGELWIGHGKFEETMSIVRSETPDERWNRVRYMVFDAPHANGLFEQRMQFLRATISEGNRFVRVVAQERCQGVTQLLAERDHVVRQGGEGVMLRQPESAYEAGRSPTLLKVKPYDDAEATVIAHEPGKGKFAGKLGALRVRADDGREFSLGSGLTDADRVSPPPVGTYCHLSLPGINSERDAEVPFLFARPSGVGLHLTRCRGASAKHPSFRLRRSPANAPQYDRRFAEAPLNSSHVTRHTSLLARSPKQPLRICPALRRPAVVDFNQADASAVVQSREQRGVKARRQRRGYGQTRDCLSAPDPQR